MESRTLCSVVNEHFVSLFDKATSLDLVLNQLRNPKKWERERRDSVEKIRKALSEEYSLTQFPVAEYQESLNFIRDVASKPIQLTKKHVSKLQSWADFEARHREKLEQIKKKSVRLIKGIDLTALIATTSSAIYSVFKYHPTVPIALLASAGCYGLDINRNKEGNFWAKERLAGIFLAYFQV